MKKMIKENIKPFICGCISTLVIIGLIFGGYKLFINIRNHKDNKTTKTEIKTKQGNTKIEISEHKTNNNRVCSAFKDSLFYYNPGLVTKDGKLYYVSDKKYSDTKENCKLLDENIRVKAIYGDYNYILENNDVVTIGGENENDIKLDESDYLKSELPEVFFTDNDIVRIDYYNSESLDNGTRNRYFVLKKDGKIYLYSFIRKYDDNTFKKQFTFESSEEYKSFKDEKIVRYEVLSHTEKQDINVIITDKNIYLRNIVNKDCMEYADVECKYDYFSNKEINKYLDKILTIGCEDSIWCDIYTTDGKDVTVDFK